MTMSVLLDFVVWIYTRMFMFMCILCVIWVVFCGVSIIVSLPFWVIDIVCGTNIFNTQDIINGIISIYNGVKE